MEELSADDKKRVGECEGYKSSKRIIKSCEDYSDYEVGTAVFIKENRKNGESYFIGQGYNSNEPKHKYIIIHKDNGFIFAKRIIASGKPGVLVSCLTIEYPSDRYELIVDGDYLDAMLLDTVESYDPTSEAKELAKKKSKASRINSKNRIMFNTPETAYAYLHTLKIGDEMWDSSTSYGNYITKYKVIKVEQYDLDIKQKESSGYRGRIYCHPHATYTNAKLPKGIKVEITQVESEYNFQTSNKTIYFYNLCNQDTYKDYIATYYSKKPTKAEDIV